MMELRCALADSDRATDLSRPAGVKLVTYSFLRLIKYLLRAKATRNERRYHIPSSLKNLVSMMAGAVLE
jgi:hypothetical protein